MHTSERGGRMGQPTQRSRQRTILPRWIVLVVAALVAVAWHPLELVERADAFPLWNKVWRPNNTAKRAQQHPKQPQQLSSLGSWSIAGDPQELPENNNKKDQNQPPPNNNNKKQGRFLASLTASLNFFAPQPPPPRPPQTPPPSYLLQQQQSQLKWWDRAANRAFRGGRLTSISPQQQSASQEVTPRVVRFSSSQDTEPNNDQEDDDTTRGTVDPPAPQEDPKPVNSTEPEHNNDDKEEEEEETVHFEDTTSEPLSLQPEKETDPDDEDNRVNINEQTWMEEEEENTGIDNQQVMTSSSSNDTENKDTSDPPSLDGVTSQSLSSEDTSMTPPMEPFSSMETSNTDTNESVSESSSSSSSSSPLDQDVLASLLVSSWNQLSNVTSQVVTGVQEKFQEGWNEAPALWEAYQSQQQAQAGETGSADDDKGTDPTTTTTTTRMEGEDLSSSDWLARKDDVDSAVVISAGASTATVGALFLSIIMGLAPEHVWESSLVLGATASVLAATDSSAGDNLRSLGSTFLTLVQNATVNGSSDLDFPADVVVVGESKDVASTILEGVSNPVSLSSAATASIVAIALGAQPELAGIVGIAALYVAGIEGMAGDVARGVGTVALALVQDVLLSSGNHTNATIPTTPTSRSVSNQVLPDSSMNQAADDTTVPKKSLVSQAAPPSVGTSSPLFFAVERQDMDEEVPDEAASTVVSDSVVAPPEMVMEPPVDSDVELNDDTLTPIETDEPMMKESSPVEADGMSRMSQMDSSDQKDSIPQMVRNSPRDFLVLFETSEAHVRRQSRPAAPVRTVLQASVEEETTPNETETQTEPARTVQTSVEKETDPNEGETPAEPARTVQASVEEETKPTIREESLRPLSLVQFERSDAQVRFFGRNSAIPRESTIVADVMTEPVLTRFLGPRPSNLIKFERSEAQSRLASRKVVTLEKEQQLSSMDDETDAMEERALETTAEDTTNPIPTETEIEPETSPSDQTVFQQDPAINRGPSEVQVQPIGGLDVEPMSTDRRDARRDVKAQPVQNSVVWKTRTQQSNDIAPQKPIAPRPVPTRRVGWRQTTTPNINVAPETTLSPNRSAPRRTSVVRKIAQRAERVEAGLSPIEMMARQRAEAAKQQKAEAIKRAGQDRKRVEVAPYAQDQQRPMIGQAPGDPITAGSEKGSDTTETFLTQAPGDPITPESESGVGTTENISTAQPTQRQQDEARITELESERRNLIQPSQASAQIEALQAERRKLIEASQMTRPVVEEDPRLPQVEQERRNILATRTEPFPVKEKVAISQEVLTQKKEAEIQQRSLLAMRLKLDADAIAARKTAEELANNKMKEANQRALLTAHVKQEELDRVAAEEKRIQEQTEIMAVERLERERKAVAAAALLAEQAQVAKDSLRKTETERQQRSLLPARLTFEASKVSSGSDETLGPDGAIPTSTEQKDLPVDSSDTLVSREKENPDEVLRRKQEIEARQRKLLSARLQLGTGSSVAKEGGDSSNEESMKLERGRKALLAPLLEKKLAREKKAEEVAKLLPTVNPVQEVDQDEIRQRALLAAQLKQSSATRGTTSTQENDEAENNKLERERKASIAPLLEKKLGREKKAQEVAKLLSTSSPVREVDQNEKRQRALLAAQLKQSSVGRTARPMEESNDPLPMAESDRREFEVSMWAKIEQLRTNREYRAVMASMFTTKMERETKALQAATLLAHDVASTTSVGVTEQERRQRLLLEARLQQTNTKQVLANEKRSHETTKEQAQRALLQARLEYDALKKD